ncbi:uncharacterized protein LOC143007935 isoform X2 [Genypterus blacodes]|uniref:uncharacterized protein LOC143007935 isoform X2 n=1 Tax=Genypterus blacodes TaxID=154954 RepID=UPI003F773A3F
MSWAEEDWTVGLSGRVLQKVKELQVQQERLSRENKQKQLQLDNSQAAFEKQAVKYERARVELQSVERELQSVQEQTLAATSARQRLSQDLQTKQAQVCSLEGQLDSSRTLNNKLTQEVKSLEAELEKLQNSSRSAETSPFSTPCWNATSHWEHSGGRKDERPGQREEGENRAVHLRQRLQFSDAPTASLPRQQHKSTPRRHPSDQFDSPPTPMAVFPWERDDSRPTARGRSPSSPQTPSTDITQGHVEQKSQDPRRETDTALSEARGRVSALEEELRVKTERLKSSQVELVQSRKELNTSELSLQKVQDQLTVAQTRSAQESERASGAEQRLKHLQEELKCQRQNTESSRLQHQQRIKELEKQHQKDLSEQQKERQCLEKQHQQELNKLNQELQQARTLHNALQAQADKVSLQKQALDKEVETLKEKLKWTEGQLRESQKKQTETQAKLTEAVREAEGVAVSLEQSRKREKALEEEGRRLSEELADALRLLKELQDQKAAPQPLPPPVQFCPGAQNFSHQPPPSHHIRPSSHTKRSSSARGEQRREEEEGEEIKTKYPTDREPGEGIDSEHINAFTAPHSEHLQRGGGRRSSPENVRANDSSVTERPITSAAPPTNASIDGDHGVLKAAQVTTSSKAEECRPSEDLRRENVGLRSELRDVREELQKRLEDLETQRRAEAEARTRLKQLSRKHASQVGEKEEQGKEWRAQLDREKVETERLRKAMATLETEFKRAREDKEMRETDEEECEKKAQEDRESEMTELNIQLKKQLAEVKGQLALEREEKRRDEQQTDIKLVELEAELEALKTHQKTALLEQKTFPETNSPVTYLTLHDDELNSNIVGLDNKFLPSPEQHRLFCQTTNQLNMVVSDTPALIREEREGSDTESSSLSVEWQTTPDEQTVGDSEDNSAQTSPGVPFLSEQGEAPSKLQKAPSDPSDLEKEVERLQKKNAMEAERASQCQAKLEALQNQVTLQTRQLTMAFEKQTLHISALLAELQQKESTFLSQGEELQLCKQELDALRAVKDEDKAEQMKAGAMKGEELHEKSQEKESVKISEHQPQQEGEEQDELSQEEKLVKIPEHQPQRRVEEQHGLSHEESQEEKSVKILEHQPQHKGEEQDELSQEEKSVRVSVNQPQQEGEELHEKNREEKAVKISEHQPQQEGEKLHGLSQEEKSLKVPVNQSQQEVREQDELSQEKKSVKFLKHQPLRKGEEQDDLSHKEKSVKMSKHQPQLKGDELHEKSQGESQEEKSVTVSVNQPQQEGEELHEKSQEEKSVKVSVHQPQQEGEELHEKSQGEKSVKISEHQPLGKGEELHELSQEENSVTILKHQPQQEVEELHEKSQGEKSVKISEHQPQHKGEEQHGLSQEESLKEKSVKVSVYQPQQEGEELHEKSQGGKLVKVSEHQPQQEGEELHEKSQGEKSVKISVNQPQQEVREQDNLSQEEKSIKISEHQPQQEEFANIFLTEALQGDTVSNTQRDEVHSEIVTSDNESPAVSSTKNTTSDLKPDRDTLGSEPPHQGSTDPGKTQSIHHPGCVKETSGKRQEDHEYSQDGDAAISAADLLALQQENRQLKQRIELLTVSETSSLASQTNTENQERTVKPDESTENERPAEALRPTRQDVKRSKDEEGAVERDDKGASGEDSQLQISRLQEQMGALQVKLQALSEENQQQAEELTLWKLASNPVPALDQNLPNTDNKPELQDQTPAVRQTQSDQQKAEDVSHVPPETQTVPQTRPQTLGLEETTPLGVLQNPGFVQIIREDELFLSCSSSKLHGRMLSSRLQLNKTSEPKSFQPPTKTPAHKEHVDDTVMADQEYEKENVEIYFTKSKSNPAQHKEKRLAELNQMPSDKAGQQQSSKPPRKQAAPKQTAKPDQTHTTSDPSQRDDWRKASVTTQTDESVDPHRAPSAPERHHAYTQTEGEEGEGSSSAPVLPASVLPASVLLASVLPASSSQAGFAATSTFPIPADPARLAERILRNRTQLSAAFDDTEYEPYGLPEVVMKGFADIPSGPSCPYIVRRGLLGTDAVPIPPKEEETD